MDKPPASTPHGEKGNTNTAVSATAKAGRPEWLNTVSTFIKRSTAALKSQGKLYAQNEKISETQSCMGTEKFRGKLPSCRKRETREPGAAFLGLQQLQKARCWTGRVTRRWLPTGRSGLAGWGDRQAQSFSADNSFYFWGLSPGNLLLTFRNKIEICIWPSLTDQIFSSTEVCTKHHCWWWRCTKLKDLALPVKEVIVFTVWQGYRPQTRLFVMWYKAPNSSCEDVMLKVLWKNTYGYLTEIRAEKIVLVLKFKGWARDFQRKNKGYHIPETGESNGYSRSQCTAGPCKRRAVNTDQLQGHQVRER